MPRPRLALLITAVFAFAVVTGAGAMASDDYGITVSSAVDVPERTTTFDGTEYTIHAIGRVSPGADIDVSVAASADTTYNVHLYNSDKQIEDSIRRTGDTSLSFPTDGLDAGSYTVAVEHDGQIQQIHPVVISAYDVTLEDAPSSITNPETGTVSVSLTILQDRGIERVEAVIADADGQTQVVLEQTNADDYEGTIDSTNLETGTYQLYIVVRGTDDVDGRKELLGVSNAQPLTIEPEPTTTTTTSDNGGGSSGGGFGGTTTTTNSTTTNSTTTNSTTTNSTTTNSTTTNSTTTSSDTNTTARTTMTTQSNTTPAPTSTSTTQISTSGTTDDGSGSADVITPNETTTTRQTTTGEAGAMFAAIRLLPVIAAFLLLRRATRY